MNRRWQLGEWLAPSSVGHYRRARRGRLRAVAKVMPAAVSDHDFERFANEVELLHACAGGGLAELVDVGRRGGTAFYVAPSYTRRSPLSGVDAAWAIVDEIGPALARLHEAGVAHRDVRPANVLWEGRRPRLIDLGLAQHRSVDGRTAGIGPLGAIPYLDPDVVRGRPSSGASDIWALGVTLHEVATGRGVHPDAAPADLVGSLDALISGDPVICDAVDPRLRSVIVGCLAPVGHRWPDMCAVLDAAATARSKVAS